MANRYAGLFRRADATSEYLDTGVKPLIVATNTTAPEIVDEARRLAHHRIDYVELASALGTQYVDYGIVRESRPVRMVEERLRMDIRLARQVARMVRSENYDTVLSLSERVGLPLTHMLDRDINHVVIMHHAMSPQKLRIMRLLNVRDRWRRIITISTAEAVGLRQALDLPHDFVQPLLTPIDTGFFQPSATPVPWQEQDHIHSLGLSHRDYPTLLRAMQRLPHIQCHLRVGSTWVNHDAGFSESDIPENVQIKPFVHPAELRRCHERSRFIVLPLENGTQWSAGCTSVQQPQAMGKAVIATARPGIAEYLVDGVTGILVPPGDDVAMASAIDHLWNEPDLAAELGRRGREYQIDHYSMDVWLTNLIRLLTETARPTPALHATLAA